MVAYDGCKIAFDDFPLGIDGQVGLVLQVGYLLKFSSCLVKDECPVEDHREKPWIDTEITQCHQHVWHAVEVDVHLLNLASLAQILSVLRKVEFARELLFLGVNVARQDERVTLSILVLAKSC